MGCCCSKAKKDNNNDNNDKIITITLKEGTHLWKAQHMERTESGHQINQTVISNQENMLCEEMANNILESESTPQDFKTIFGSPFNECNELLSFLYLTGIGGLTKENIFSYRFNLIVNATYEWPTIQMKDIMTIRVPVDDSTTENIYIYFDEISEKIEECRIKGGKVLVHCMAGASRSSTVVLAYLMKYNGMPLKSAFVSVHKRRESARPNMGFWEQLIRYETTVRGLPSVRLMEYTEEGYKVVVPDFYKNQFPDLYRIEVIKQIKIIKLKRKNPGLRFRSKKQFKENTLRYE